jgi:hypothetical protein
MVIQKRTHRRRKTQIRMEGGWEEGNTEGCVVVTLLGQHHDNDNDDDVAGARP